MLIANISFGLTAFTPPGWILMAVLILLEETVLGWHMSGSPTSGITHLTALSMNVISGLVGIGGS